MREKTEEPWSFTRPDSRASGIFFFQNCGSCGVRHIPHLENQSIQHIYLDCFPYNRLAVLDNEAKMWLMSGESQCLRANAAANIDNQRALREVSPGVPCKSNFSKSDIGSRRCVASPNPHGRRSSSQRACFSCCSWQPPIEQIVICYLDAPTSSKNLP